MKFLFFSIIFTACAQLPFIKLKKGHTEKQHHAKSKNIMIASQGKASSLAGLKMIEMGGNAFDAAAAVSFAISVERPQSTGIGGGGFMLLDGPQFKEPIALDFREMAPMFSHKKMYLDKKGNVVNKKSSNGIFASGVPGLVAGVLWMHEKYGKLKRQDVIAPAIKLALKGFKVYPHLEKAIKVRLDVLNKYPASRKIFFKNGSPLKQGDLLVQKDLAKTLKAISDFGVSGFYKGWVSDEISKEFKRQGGLISKVDLNNYKVKVRKPITSEYKGYKLFSMPPPSSGGTHIVQILKILDIYNLAKLGIDSPFTIHKVSEAMKLAFYDRAKYMGDSDFVKVPIKGLTSDRYIKKLQEMIGVKALDISSDKDLDAFSYESDETTHFSIIDKKGNTISSTQTINYLLGSGVVIPNTGIVMNNEMDDFATKKGASNLFGAIGGNNNLVEAGKRPLSSMSPTILKKGKEIITLGTPAGTKILTCVTQVILNHLEFKMPLYKAVNSIRYHHQWKPDTIFYEAPGFGNEVSRKLVSMGHKLKEKELGCKVQAVKYSKGELEGVSDNRGEGLAIGI